MACTDRQLTPAQVAEGFSTRIGVQKAIRPFTGEPSGSNLVDYLNRELFPVVKAMRSKVNEVYLPSKEQAPSANPLNYLFSTNTTNADPTTAYIRLDNATQNAATTIRVSETNAGLKNVATWLSVMASGTTTPLGVVTLQHATDPGRFVRFNLSSALDQGAYWNLGVTPVESSHANPFVEGDPIQIGFIAGVASGGVSLATSIANIQGISAGTQLQTSGTLVFSNTNGVSFGLSNSSVLTASVATSLTNIAISAGTNSALLSSLVFSNSRNLSFGLAGSTITGQPFFLVSDAVGTSENVTRLAFAAAGNLTLLLTTGASQATLGGTAAVGLSAGTSAAVVTGITFQNSNGVSFGQSGNSITASVATSLTAIRVSAGTTSNLLSALTFSNGSGVSFGLNASVITASVATSLTNINVSAGTTSQNLSALTFSNSNGVSFGLNGSVVTGSVATSLTAFNISAGTTSNNLSALVFSNSNNVSFGLNGSTITASASQSAQTFIGGIAGGTQTATSGTIVFSNSNDMSFGLSGSTRMTASYLPQIGLVSHIGGNQVSSVTRLAFSNASNVTFSLATAANAATLLASVAAAGGAGIAGINADSDYASNSSELTTGTLRFARGDANLAGGFSFNSNVQNVGLRFGTGTASTVVYGQAIIRASVNLNATDTAGLLVTKFQFSNSNGVRWGVSTTSNADGREAVFTANAAPDLIAYQNFVGHQGGAFNGQSPWQGTMVSVGFCPLNQQQRPFPGNMTANTFALMYSAAGAVSSNSTWGLSIRLGLYTMVNSTQLSLVNSVLHTQSATTQGTAQRNAEQTGRRYISIHSSEWSSQPVLSAGAQYWMAYLVSQQNLSGSIFGAPVGGGGNPYFGFLGESVSATSMRFPLFGGPLSTTNIPGSIGATQILTQTSIATNISFSVMYNSVPCVFIAQSVKVAYP